jgi:hypothetical protein
MVWTFLGIEDFQEDGPKLFGLHQGGDHGPLRSVAKACPVVLLSLQEFGISFPLRAK